MISIQATCQPSLQARAAEIVHALGGAWHSEGAMCRCPAHPDRTPSLSVRVGTRSLLLKCFAGCTASEILDAIRRLKLSVPSLPAASAGSHPVAVAYSPTAARAREIWDSAHRLAGTKAEAYLVGRGISLVSDALRYHVSTPVGRGAGVCFRPALIAAVSDGASVIAIQRIFLDRAEPVLARDLPTPKLTLGRPLSGAVMLQPAAQSLGLAEGVETALSASILLDLPVWAVLGNERLARISIPATVRRLVLLPDNDAAGRLSERRARSTYARPDLAIETLWPWDNRNDWNDVLVRPEAMRKCTI